MIIRKINKKAFGKFIATGLVIMTATTFTGCGVSAKEKDTTNLYIETKEETATNDLMQVTENIDTKIVNQFDELLDSLDNSEVTIDDTTLYMVDNMDEISATDQKITDEEMYIASYAYQKLLKSNISKEVFLEELNNIMVEQLLPRGMDEEEWMLNFGNLTSTLNERESLQDTYQVLAYLIHDANCDEKHTVSEYGSIDCKVLQKQFKDKYK